MWVTPVLQSSPQDGRPRFFLNIQIVAPIGFGGLGIVLQQRRRRHHHAGRAEAALQTVVVLKRLLDGVERAVRGCLTFNGGNLRALRLDRQHCAGLYRLAVHMDDTGTALARVTAHMGAGEPEVLAQELHQQRAAFDLTFGRLAVHGHLYFGHSCPPRLLDLFCWNELSTATLR